MHGSLLEVCTATFRHEIVRVIHHLAEVRLSIRLAFWTSNTYSTEGLECKGCLFQAVRKCLGLTCCSL